MARKTSTVDEVLMMVPRLTKAERRKLLAELCTDPDLLEDLHDIATLLERRGGRSRPYEEFAEELRAEGRL